MGAMERRKPADDDRANCPDDPARHNQPKAEGPVVYSIPVSQHHPHRPQPSAPDTLGASQGAVGKVRSSLGMSCSLGRACLPLR